MHKDFWTGIVVGGAIITINTIAIGSMIFGV